MIFIVPSKPGHSIPLQFAPTNLNNSAPEPKQYFNINFKTYCSSKYVIKEPLNKIKYPGIEGRA